MMKYQNPMMALFALLIGISACQPAPEPEIQPGAPKIRLEVGEPVTVPTAEHPDISVGPRLVTLPDGRVLMGRGDVSLTTSDSGITWDVGPAIARPHLLPLRDRSYFFFKGRGLATGEPGLFSLETARVQALDEDATDERISWSAATARVDWWAPLTADNETEVDYLNVGGPFLELEDGTLLAASYGNFKGDTVPMEGFPATSGQKWFKYRTYLLDSSDGGANWEYLSTIAYDGVTGQESFCEPAMVDLGGGELLAVMRTGRFAPMYQARSLDGGKTWQKPESMHVPGLAPQMVLLDNGALVCSFGWRRLKVGYGHGLNDEGGPYPAAARDYQERYRQDVGIENPSEAAGDYVMVSLDKGKTWSEPRKLAEPLTSGYTLLAATGPDTVLVVSARLTLPGQSQERHLEIWEREWPRWSDKSVVVRVARKIRIVL